MKQCDGARIHRLRLENGLRVVHVEDRTTQMVTVNTLYAVGSRNELPERTGFAHLFEHLMFGGTTAEPDFDRPLQEACGDNNAFTTNDYTNYYDTLPVQNIEVALRLESDRMRSLAFTPRSLEVQRKVVVEEFHQNYICQPYGDMLHLLSSLCFPPGHSYSWPTIGLVPEHISTATMEEVKRFFQCYYRPSNAILCIVGNITWERTQELVHKWYDDVPAVPQVLAEDIQASVRTEPQWPHRRQRRLTVRRDVPNEVLVLAFSIPSRLHPDFAACDMLSDVLGNGRSSLLWRRLVEEQHLLTHVDASVNANMGDGLLVIEALPAPGVALGSAEEALWECIADLRCKPLEERTLEKVKNKFEACEAMQSIDIPHVAHRLALFEMLGDAHLIDEEIPTYRAVTSRQLHAIARRILTKVNSFVLSYKQKN